MTAEFLSKLLILDQLILETHSPNSIISHCWIIVIHVLEALLSTNLSQESWWHLIENRTVCKKLIKAQGHHACWGFEKRQNGTSYTSKDEDKRREVDEVLTSPATNPLEEAEPAPDWTTYWEQSSMTQLMTGLITRSKAGPWSIHRCQAISICMRTT